MIDAALELISVAQTQDDSGVWRDVETTRQVFCRVDAITRREFFDAGQAGLNPEQKFIVAAADYGGETLVRYEGARYSVYRTYRQPGADYMELYAERKVGAHGQ